uniref:RNA-binding protein that suppresses calcineurin deletion Rnc1 n=1 Tax=Puya raimondii TaxID=112807 RepID=A0A8A0WI41_PUYRA|nr:RNA-binding protein that suppresses calcineurin deletion Rnc1 [Puya raimondii]
MDPEDESCQPQLRRQLEDVDYVSVEFEGRQIGWQDVAAYKAWILPSFPFIFPPQDALFAHPRLFRACVPPGMHRFRGNIWDFDHRPKVMRALGYPLHINDRIPEITEARNIELGLGLQLCFMHPSKYKFEHPRFCFERLEYVGQKIQDLVMAERLLMKHLDAPGRWLQEKHRRTLMNKFCGRYLRDKHLHHYIIYSESVQDKFEHNRRLRNPATTSVQQAIHGLAYMVYGKPDVRRLMFEYVDDLDLSYFSPTVPSYLFPQIANTNSKLKNIFIAKRMTKRYGQGLRCFQNPIDRLVLYTSDEDPGDEYIALCCYFTYQDAISIRSGCISSYPI